MQGNKLYQKQLRAYFKGNDSFEVSDISEFYEQFEPDLKRGTLDWRIHELVKEEIIYRISRGTYTLSEVQKYVPSISLSLKQLFGKLKKEFPYTNICIWSTKWLSQWMLHIPNTYLTVVESEKDTESSVFHFLREIRNNVFLQPSSGILENYANFEKDIIIVKTLITQAPIREKEKTVIPEIEKILVDIAVDSELFEAYQGRDLEMIYQNVQDQYTINQSRLLRYAGRRNKTEEIKTLLNQPK